MQEQHKVRYEEYLKLSGEEKSNYFEEMEQTRPLAAILRNDQAGTLGKEVLVFNIDKEIVDVIIAQLLLDYDPQNEEEAQSRMGNYDTVFTLVDEGEAQHYETT